MALTPNNNHEVLYYNVNLLSHDHKECICCSIVQDNVFTKVLFTNIDRYIKIISSKSLDKI